MTSAGRLTSQGVPSQLGKESQLHYHFNIGDLEATVGL